MPKLLPTTPNGKTREGKIHARVTGGALRILREEAKMRDMSISQLIRHILGYWNAQGRP